ncbi:Diacylglycerol kinase [Thecaphora frezii]
MVQSHGGEINVAPRSSPQPSPATTTPDNLTRQRSSSLQKGAAVLRALSRAESDFDRQLLRSAHPDALSYSTHTTDDDDDRASPNSALRRRTNAAASSSSSSSSSSHPAPASANHDANLNATALPTSQPTNNSWEIPRKLFHSSIGGLVLYLYLNHVDLDVIVRNLSYFLAIVVTADVIRLNNAHFEAFYETLLGFLMRDSEKEKVNGVVWYLIGVITSLHFFPQDIACVSIMILSWCDTCASTFGRLLGRYTPPLPSPPFARRKSTAGFVAAVLSGALTSYFFWCTPIASLGEREYGISWSGSGLAHPAIFGTHRVAGAARTGWNGLARGFLAQHGDGLKPRAAAGGAAAQYLGVDAIASGKLGTHAARISDGDVPGMPWWLLTLGSGVVAGVAEALELGGVDDNLSLPILSATGIWAMLYAWGRAAQVVASFF